MEAAAAYSQYSDRLKGAGAKEIFDDTGCYYLCTYHVRARRMNSLVCASWKKASSKFAYPHLVVLPPQEYRMNLVMEDSMSEKAPPYEDDENQASN